MLTVKEVAGRLKISLSKAYALVETGELAHYRIGGSIRVSEEQLQQFLDGARREGPARTPAGPFRHLKV